jgi:hypothetical protein
MRVDQASGGLSRRHFLALGSGTALALILGQAALAETTLSLEDFLELSGRLLDRPAGSLSPDYAGLYLESLDTKALESLIGGAADAALEQKIIQNWYTGLHAAGSGEAVATYTDALIREALDYTKPMGWCGGETGYWADAPEGEA